MRSGVIRNVLDLFHIITQNVLEVKTFFKNFKEQVSDPSILTTPHLSATICPSPRSLPPSIASPALWRRCLCGVRKLSQETIARILSVEREAVGVHDDAQRQAARLIKEAEEAASTLREQTLAQARQEAEEILAAGREAAEAERARIIALAEAEAEHMETLATRHLDRAVSFVRDQVAGRE